MKRDGSHITVSVIEGHATNWSVALHGSKWTVWVGGGIIEGDVSVVKAEGDLLVIEFSKA